MKPNYLNKMAARETGCSSVWITKRRKNFHFTRALLDLRTYYLGLFCFLRHETNRNTTRYQIITDDCPENLTNLSYIMAFLSFLVFLSQLTLNPNFLSGFEQEKLRTMKQVWLFRNLNEKTKSLLLPEGRAFALVSRPRNRGLSCSPFNQLPVDSVRVRNFLSASAVIICAWWYKH